MFTSDPQLGTVGHLPLQHPHHPIKIGRPMLDHNLAGMPAPPNNESCNNYSVTITLLCLFNHTQAPSVINNLSPVARGKKVLHGHDAANICIELYAQYSQYKIFHVKHFVRTIIVPAPARTQRTGPGAPGRSQIQKGTGFTEN